MKKSTLLLLAGMTLFAAKGIPNIKAQTDTTSKEIYELVDDRIVDDLNLPNDSAPVALEFQSLWSGAIDSLVNKNVFTLDFEFEDRNNQKKSIYLTVTDEDDYRAINMLYDRLIEFNFVFMSDKFVVRKDGTELFYIKDNGDTNYNKNDENLIEIFDILSAIINEVNNKE